LSADPGTPFVSVVVPVLNGEATLRDCLQSLSRVRYPPTRREVLVVDNGSTDRTAKIARVFPARRVLEPRRGLPHARNRGIAESDGEVVAFIDADCLVSADWLRELVAGVTGDGVSAAAGELVAYPTATAAERYYARRRPLWQAWGHDRPQTWFVQGNAALRREVFDEVGLYDGRFAGIGCEDIDFAWRFLEAGLRVAYAPRAVAFHRHRSTVRGLLAQQMGYGRGQAVLLEKHDGRVRWGWREELSAWRDLAVSARLTARVWRAGRRAPRGSSEAEFHALDLLRKAAQHYGFVSGILRGSCVAGMDRVK
jgi:GT2 family glycosyltransferase